jgi:hypothetical protein
MLQTFLSSLFLDLYTYNIVTELFYDNIHHKRTRTTVHRVYAEYGKDIRVHVFLLLIVDHSKLRIQYNKNCIPSQK